MSFWSLDTETTGVDPYHGSYPYFVTMCNDHDEVLYWEWDVDPLTRTPQVNLDDLDEIEHIINNAEGLVCHNALFDFKMLHTLEDFYFDWGKWPWEKIHDTLLSAHMFASSQRKDLTTLSLLEFMIDVSEYEKPIEAATKKARTIARSKAFVEEHGEWAIAKAGRPDMPSAGDKDWKIDMWLPRALLKHAPDYVPGINNYEDPEAHPWANALEEYANADSGITLPLFHKHQERLRDMKLDKIYEERRKVLRITYDMRENGVTLNSERLVNLYDDYDEISEGLHDQAVAVSDGGIDRLPVNGRSTALDSVIFDHFGLTTKKKSKKTGKPAMDKGVISGWLEDLEEGTPAHTFLTCLRGYRQRKTAMSYLQGYERYWLEEQGDTYRLHPSLNPVGTNTLRWSSRNPNEQNISKKEGFNLRYAFGPAPGRCWASLDFNNIELRIPAYESGEEVMIEIFEKPDSAPYFGSYHLVNASIVFPEEFANACSYDGEFKEKYPTLYSRIKNFGFAVAYGAVMREDGWGTADRACGVKGAHLAVSKRLKKHKKLNDYWVGRANRTGFVETMPDLTVDPERGYPLQCQRTKYNRISPTIPLNYHVQGTACWIIMKAMIKVQAYLDKINATMYKDNPWYMTMQIHDELVIDFPKKGKWKMHLNKIRKLMESCGDDIQVPLTVGCEIHENSWDVGVELPS